MITYPEAITPATEVRTIHSKKVKQDYRISVALPYSYLYKPQKQYAAIFLLDANWSFGLVTELTRINALCGQFPETIVVGIGYPVEKPSEAPFNQVDALRTRDFTPVVDRNVEEEEEQRQKQKRVRTGGAAKFLEFIKTELIPVIEAEFRASPTDRILAGHSYGGLFVLYTLFHQPKLFKGYVAGSPTLWYGDKVTFGYESQFAKTHKTLRKKLYINDGDLEEGAESQMVSNIIQFAARLKSRRYKEFSLTMLTIVECDHCATYGSTYQAGLWAVLT